MFIQGKDCIIRISPLVAGRESAKGDKCRGGLALPIDLGRKSLGFYNEKKP